MKLPRTRFKLWMLMILVAVAAVGMGIVRIVSMRSVYLQKAAEYRLAEQDELKILGTLDRRITWLAAREGEDAQDSLKAVVEVRANRRTWAGYYGKLKQQYEMAASRPWMPFSPDSPPLMP